MIGEEISYDVKYWATSTKKQITDYAETLKAPMLAEMQNETNVSRRNQLHLRNTWKTYETNKNNKDIYGVKATRGKQHIVHLVAFGHQSKTRYIPGRDFPGEIHDKYQEMLNRKIEEVLNNG